MATLNHTNLTTYNVPALKEFFNSVFGFQILNERGDKLAVMRNSEGFVLTLMYDKRMTPEQGYPGLFHVGFLQPTQHAVDLMHEALIARSIRYPSLRGCSAADRQPTVFIVTLLAVCWWK